MHEDQGKGMTHKKRFFLLGRLIAGKASEAAPAIGAAGPQQVPDAPMAPATLSGETLEQAYRELLVEHHILQDTNRRLHERLSRREQGRDDSPAVRELIQTQRNALVERSRRLRELEYENNQIRREQKKLLEENKRLATSLARHMQDIQPLLKSEELSRRELADAKAALREKTNELLRLTDKYYQLEARSGAQPPPASAANLDF